MMGSAGDEPRQYSESIQVLSSIAVGEHYSSKSLYNALHTGGQNQIPEDMLVERSLSEEKRTEYERKVYDSTGATLLHQLFRYQKWELFKWTVTNFPDFGLVPHRLQDGDKILPYGGQNILHMAVLAGQYDKAKWILNFYSRHSDSALRSLILCRVSTQGKSFFNKDGGAYFGETPLQFAVSVGDKNMVDLILSFASMSDPAEYIVGNGSSEPTRSLIFYPDCNGNTVVHLCAIHGNVEMYEHVKHVALEMLQQEFMTVLHHCMTLREENQEGPISLTRYQPPTVRYNDVYPDEPLFTFRGHHRKLTPVAMPSMSTQNLFFDVQVYKYLDKLIEKGAEEIEAVLFLGRLREDKLDIQIKLEPPGNQSGHRMPVMTRRRSVVGGPDDGHLRMIPSRMRSTQSVTKEFMKELQKQKYFQEPDCIKTLEQRLKLELGQWLHGAENGVKSGIVIKLFREIFVFALNGEGHSPVTVAASAESGKGKAPILRLFITDTINKQDRSYEYDLTGIEFALPVIDSAGQPLYFPPVADALVLRSSVSWICRNTNFHTLIEGIPEIKTLMKEKWNRVGSPRCDNNLINDSIVFSIMLVLNFLIGLEHPSARLAIGVTVPFGAYSLWIHYQWGTYAKQLLKTLTWEICNIGVLHISLRLLAVLCVAVSFITVFVLQSDLLLFSTLGLMACLACLLIDVALTMDSFGSLLVTVVHIIWHDFRNFLILLVAVLLFFALATKNMIPAASGTPGNLVLIRKLFTLLQRTFQYTPGDEGELEQFFLTGFHLSITLVSTNLFIAVMNSTYDTWNDEKKVAHTKLLCERYLWMESYLNLISVTEIASLLSSYCHKRAEFKRGVIINGGLGDGNIEIVDTFCFHVAADFSANDADARDKLFQNKNLEPATVESNGELVTQAGSTIKHSFLLKGDGISIFHPDFWVTENGSHPQPGQLIHFSSINNFWVKPVDHHQIDYCRYVASELEKSGKIIQISHYKRVVLIILDPQNDFSDRVAGIYRRSACRIADAKDDGTEFVRPGSNLDHRRVHLVANRKRKGQLVPSDMAEGLSVLWDDRASEDADVVAADLRYEPETVNAVWQTALNSSNQLSPAAKKVFLTNDPHRRGTLVGLKWHVLEQAPYVEILWDADKFTFAELCVEGSGGESNGDWRGRLRLEFAFEKKLRVYHTSDVRDDQFKRYGYIENTGKNEVFVVWDLSVPWIHNLLELTNDPPSFEPLKNGDRVRFRIENSRIKGSGKLVSFRSIGSNEYAEVFWDRDNVCGNLPVPGAFDDFTALRKLIEKQPALISEVYISRDCHRSNHISHKSFWRQSSIDMTTVSQEVEISESDDVQVVDDLEMLTAVRAYPEDHTIIRYIDLLTGKYRPSNTRLLVSSIQGSITASNVLCMLGLLHVLFVGTRDGMQ
jgi:hypothetical protein